MIIRFKNTTKFESPGNTIWDYEIGADIGVSLQKLTGRGPAEGKYLNKVCHEVYFIINGSGTFYVGEETFMASANDVIVVEPNTPHFIETEHLEYITITRPDWFESQAAIV